MKRNRKAFIANLSAFIGAIIFETVIVGFIVFTIWYLSEFKNYISICISLIVIFAIFFIAFFIFFGIIVWQWVSIDENKIIARNLFGKIREITWETVIGIKEVPIIIYGNCLSGHCYIFIDSIGGQICAKILYNTKRIYIRIMITKRSRQFLLQLKPDLKITQYNGE